MQQKSKCEVQITMVTGSSFEAARSKYKLLYALVQNYGLPNLFDGVVAEYCGFIIRKDKSEKLMTLDTRILSRRAEIEEIAKQYGGIISPEVTSMYNIIWGEITRTDLAEASQQIEDLIGEEDIETVTYYDSYGKECDVKPKKHSKSEAVLMIVKKLKEKYSIPFVIIGGDSQDEDLKMYTQNKEIKTVLENRKKGFAMIWINGEVETVFGNESIELQNEVAELYKKSEKEENIQGGNVISGSIANRGKVKGVARVLTTYKDIYKVQKGDIIVATMTTPDYVSAMEKAAGFITDEGGITCHAAILSRKFNIPCIVGTINATKEIKDGEMIELDAYNGKIHKLD